jgi:hypothetical protein
MWLLPHVERGIGIVVLLLFPALTLTIVKKVGKSIPATIFIHAIYNLTGSYPQNCGISQAIPKLGIGVLRAIRDFVTPSTEAASQQKPLADDRVG